MESRYWLKNILYGIIADRITIDDNLCSNGKPTIRGKRITVQTVLEFLSAGENQQEILRQYPSLKIADIAVCLKFGRMC